jgi:hypothetical protein
MMQHMNHWSKRVSLTGIVLFTLVWAADRPEHRAADRRSEGWAEY